jgi:hypothetical protein
VVLRPIAESGPERDVFALLPPARRHPLAAEALEALAAISAELGHRERPGPQTGV